MVEVSSLLTGLLQWDLYNQRVLLRADLNVPLNAHGVINDHRLQAVVPTLNYIVSKGAKLIIATHIGRPINQESELSTRHLIPWFQQHAFPIEFAADLADAYTKSMQPTTAIVLVENLRFFKGEKTADPLLAQQLAKLGDYYVNDAFGLLHRADTSITLVPELFSTNRRSVGLLIEQECTMLNRLITAHEKPYVVILGGGKVADKLPLLQALLPKVDTIILGPALVFTFLQALGKPVGASLVDVASIPLCKQILADAQRANVTVIFPVDYQVAHGSFNGPLSFIDADDFQHDSVGVSIGPKTAHLIAPIIRQARTIFANGLMGSVQKPETLKGSGALFKAMTESQGFSVIGGGDSGAAAHLLGYADKISYISTGGGATLAYLAGQELPGLAAFIKTPDKNLRD